jgi:hypothetical protein
VPAVSSKNKTPDAAWHQQLHEIDGSGLHCTGAWTNIVPIFTAASMSAVASLRPLLGRIEMREADHPRRQALLLAVELADLELGAFVRMGDVDPGESDGLAEDGRFQPSRWNRWRGRKWRGCRRL